MGLGEIGAFLALPGGEWLPARLVCSNLWVLSLVTEFWAECVAEFWAEYLAESAWTLGRMEEFLFQNVVEPRLSARSQ